jgi:hypothetical protein
VVNEEGVHRSLEFVSVERFREGAFDRSFPVVGDFHSVAESGQERLLSLHEEDLQEMLTDHVAGAQLEGLMHPCDLLRYRLLLDKDGPELPIGGEAGEGGFVDVPLMLAKKEEHFFDDGRGDVFVEFVRFHGWRGGRSKSDRLGHARRILR